MKFEPHFILTAYSIEGVVLGSAATPGARAASPVRRAETPAASRAAVPASAAAISPAGRVSGPAAPTAGSAGSEIPQTHWINISFPTADAVPRVSVAMHAAYMNCGADALKGAVVYVRPLCLS